MSGQASGGQQPDPGRAEATLAQHYYVHGLMEAADEVLVESRWRLEQAKRARGGAEKKYRVDFAERLHMVANILTERAKNLTGRFAPDASDPRLVIHMFDLERDFGGVMPVVQGKPEIPIVHPGGDTAAEAVAEQAETVSELNDLITTLTAESDEFDQRLAAVRAEAVADERQRIAADIRARKYDDAPFIGAAGPEACSLAGVRTFNAALEECASAVERGAAGSVPVATPEVHDVGCEVAYGQGSCFCQRRADVEFSHTAPDRVATPTEPDSTLGARLAATRARLGKSYAQVATETGLSTSTLYGAEHGMDVRISTAAVLERWLASS